VGQLKNPIAAHIDAARKALSQIDEGLMSDGPDWRPDPVALADAFDNLVEAVVQIDRGLKAMGPKP
jgi:hypothetical protein